MDSSIKPRSTTVEGETLPKDLRPVEGNAEMSDEMAVVKDLESLESLYMYVGDQKREGS
eukprot:CAMPEP_0170099092 /NCGR_PEP_ID=MMETSP0020_2-20130122/823_1 /TAXON_ID=98059 /ORGANISM="Dinobryon sp., Strain UTEXLB2267" /LENGTH=58 /DNA_ID=CAMNT_0010321663 /DNA_START=140 /DNA_END=316 /DNA_ORIENTATION=-